MCAFAAARPSWAAGDHYRVPGPIQARGAPHITACMLVRPWHGMRMLHGVSATRSRLCAGWLGIALSGRNRLWLLSACWLASSTKVPECLRVPGARYPSLTRPSSGNWSTCSTRDAAPTGQTSPWSWSSARASPLRWLGRRSPMVQGRTRRRSERRRAGGRGCSMGWPLSGKATADGCQGRQGRAPAQGMVARFKPAAEGKWGDIGATH